MSDEETPTMPTATDEVVDESQTPTPLTPNQIAHQAREREQIIERFMRGLAQRGVIINLSTLDVNNLRTCAESFAACRILVAKGICTEAEVQHEVYGALIQMLGTILQTVEAQQLAATKPQMVLPNGKGLLVPKH